jgi:CheY-like chemotaxis protein
MRENLAGLHILVVEDQAMIVLLLEDILEDLGAHIVGPATSVADGLRLAAEQPIDAALLDINLGRDEQVYPIAEALAAQRVPFAFVTGYGSHTLPESLRRRPTLQKPFRIDDLVGLLGQLTGRGAAGPGHARWR